MTKRADEVDLLVPDGSEVNVHAMQTHTDHDHGRTGPCPAQGVMCGAFGAHGIIDDIVANEEHFIAEAALVELAAGGLLHPLVAILSIDNARTHAGGPLNLKSMAC